CTVPRPPLRSSLTFLLQRPGAHGALHSFPTRRSSDLLQRVAIGFGIAAVVGIALGAVVGQSIWAMRGLDPIFQITAPRAMPTTADRKSTRLNSSHVKISYAVFCLKKKKNKN